MMHIFYLLKSRKYVFAYFLGIAVKPQGNNDNSTLPKSFQQSYPQIWWMPFPLNSAT